MRHTLTAESHLSNCEQTIFSVGFGASLHNGISTVLLPNTNVSDGNKIITNIQIIALLNDDSISSLK